MCCCCNTKLFFVSVFILHVTRSPNKVKDATYLENTLSPPLLEEKEINSVLSTIHTDTIHTKTTNGAHNLFCLFLRL